MSATFSVPARPKKRISGRSCFRFFCRPENRRRHGVFERVGHQVEERLAVRPDRAVGLFQLVGHGVQRQARDRLALANQCFQALLEQIGADLPARGSGASARRPAALRRASAPPAAAGRTRGRSRRRCGRARETRSLHRVFFHSLPASSATSRAPPSGVGGLLGALLHLPPDLLAAVARQPFNRHVGHCRARTPGNRRTDNVPDRFVEAGFPDEVDRVDAVHLEAAPAREHREETLPLFDQPPMREEEDARRLPFPLRGVLRDEFVENPRDLFRGRAEGAGRREFAAAQVDDVPGEDLALLGRPVARGVGRCTVRSACRVTPEPTAARGSPPAPCRPPRDWPR